MLTGERVGLRARQDADVAILHRDLYDDASVRVRADSRPWLPMPATSPASPYRVVDSDGTAVVFSVVELSNDGQLAGEALLWGIDAHNRSAHVGISLRPEFRGRALGTDVVRVLCYYGFSLRGLHRLQVDTLVSNVAMLRAAAAAGFAVEGTLRQAAWVDGEFADEVVLGLLANEWSNCDTYGHDPS